MTKLIPPNNKIVLKILNSVSFEDRLIGYRLGERSGIAKISLYSFEEVIGFLQGPFVHLDFTDLERWAKLVLGDDELAKLISKAVEIESNDHDRIQRIKSLMEERLAQCKK